MTGGQIRLDFDAALAPNGDPRAVNAADATRARRPLTRDDVMTAHEVAALLRLPGSSVYHLARRGAIPGHRVGRAWRFIRYEIEDWLRAN